MISPLFLDTDDKRFFPIAARKVITEICEATEIEVRERLPMLAGEIELEARTASRVIPELGCTGSAISGSRIRWAVDPSRQGGLVTIAKTQLRRTLVHEPHHVARGWVRDGSAIQPTLMDAVVSEGLATAFERDVTGHKPPWGEYPAEVTDWIGELLRVPHTASYRSWMFSHPDVRRWIGYRTGVYIVDKVRMKTGLSAAELVNASTSEVLRLAGIEGGPIAGIVMPRG